MNSKMQYKIDLKALSYFSLLMLLGLFIYSLARLVFFGSNLSYFSQQSSENIALAFVHGLRFDLASLMMINAPLLLLVLIASPIKRFSPALPKLMSIWFLLSNIPLLLSNFSDAAYFPFTGRRSGLEVAAMLPDMMDQTRQLFGQFWPLMLIAFGFVALLIWATRWLNQKSPRAQVNILVYSSLVICFLALTVLSIRGGLQRKPIRAIHAYSWPDAELGPLVLNTSFTLIKQKGSQLKTVDFFSSDAKARQELSPAITPPSSKPSKDNVVIIILESLGLEYFAPPFGKVGYAPFLQSLSEQGTFFANGFANGRRSIDAVPSILAGIPSLMSEPFVRSPYQGDTLYGIGNILKEHGYKTWFFHGAKNGSMYFDAITERLGMDNYMGKNEYDNDDDFDGNWGIFDEPFLQFMAQQLKQSPTPFLASVFTLSSHNPYTLPEQYQGKIAKGEIPMHSVVRYTDIALQHFFNTIKTAPWYKDTLFVITSDHTSDNFDPDFATPLGRHRIPIILYHPQGKMKSQVRFDIAQQLDIPATIVDYLNIDAGDKLLPFGESLLKTKRQGGAFFKELNDYWLVENSNYIRMDQSLQFSEAQALPFIGQKSEEKSQLKQKLKAYTQLYHNGLINNSLYQSN